MATTTENLYTGDGSTDLFSFTFPYISVGDVYVSIDGANLTQTTEYILANATTVQILTPPADGSAVRIYRSTDITDVKALFFPGSAIRARDLNDNFTQNLYVTQEATFESGSATSAAAAAAASAASAASDAQDAADKATDAEAAAVAADAKADTALAGVSTAQTAATDAQAAASTAEAAATQAAADAQEATDAVETILDAVEDGAVVSVNGQGGVVSLGIGDLTDVEIASAGHVPSEGQVLTWHASMNHWMPVTIEFPDNSLDIASLPTLP